MARRKYGNVADVLLFKPNECQRVRGRHCPGRDFHGKPTFQLAYTGVQSSNQLRRSTALNAAHQIQVTTLNNHSRRVITGGRIVLSDPFEQPYALNTYSCGMFATSLMPIANKGRLDRTQSYKRSLAPRLAPLPESNGLPIAM